MAEKVNITLPAGRIVGGDLYTVSTTDIDGKPMVYKSGPDAGKPRSVSYIHVAIPKEPGHTHWSQTVWGAKMWEVGHRAFPQFAGTADFAWKVEDGDDATPQAKRKGRKNCDTEGYRGCWIVKMSNGFPPKLFRQEGAGFVQMLEKDAIKPGYFVEVAVTVDGNGAAQQPGIFVNHNMVCFRAYGPEIVFGPDVASAGFGQTALPAGATLAPPPSSIPLPQVGVPAIPVPVTTGLPVIPGVPVPVPVAAAPARSMTALAQGATYEQLIANGWTDASLVAQGLMLAPPLAPVGSVPTAPGAAPIVVAPNPQFAQMPPPVVPAVPAAPVRNMTALAQGATYEQLIANGWTDGSLVQNGLMLA